MAGFDLGDSRSSPRPRYRYQPLATSSLFSHFPIFHDVDDRGHVAVHDLVVCAAKHCPKAKFGWMWCKNIICIEAWNTVNCAVYDTWNIMLRRLHVDETLQAQGS